MTGVPRDAGPSDAGSRDAGAPTPVDAGTMDAGTAPLPSGALRFEPTGLAGAGFQNAVAISPDGRGVLLAGRTSRGSTARPTAAAPSSPRAPG